MFHKETHIQFLNYVNRINYVYKVPSKNNKIYAAIDPYYILEV